MTAPNTTPAMELLQAAENRQLAAVIDAIDQAQLAWLRPGSPVTPAAAQESRLVVHLMMAGLAQVGPEVQMVAWRDGLAPGRRVLPTEQGRALLEQWRHQLAAQPAGSMPVIGFGGSDHR